MSEQADTIIVVMGAVIVLLVLWLVKLREERPGAWRKYLKR